MDPLGTFLHRHVGQLLFGIRTRRALGHYIYYIVLRFFGSLLFSELNTFDYLKVI